MAALVDTVKVYVSYAPPDGAAAFRLKLIVPGNKTMAALAKAFVKTVAKTRAGVAAIDLADHYCARLDDSYLNPTRLVSEAVSDGEDIKLVKREAPPPKPKDEKFPAIKNGKSVFRETAYFTAASVGVPNG